MCNQIPSVGGVLFFGTHPLAVWIWIGLRLRQTYEAHSGYCFHGTLLDRLGFLCCDAAVFHDHHHTVNKGNFGSTYVDYIFGTSDYYFAAGGYESYVRKGKETRGKNK